MKENIIQSKTFDFAIRIINVYKYLKQNKNEYVLSKQLLRSGTSIGANIEEALGGQSKNDFVSKLSVAYKEARESSYWIKLLEKSDYISCKESQSLLDDLTEILKIIGKIQKTIKTNS
jgi:four helix bundle protein